MVAKRSPTKEGHSTTIIGCGTLSSTSNRIDLVLTDDQEKPPVAAWFISQEQTTFNTCDNNNNHRGGTLIEYNASKRYGSACRGLRANDHVNVPKRTKADQVTNKDMIMNDDKDVIMTTTLFSLNEREETTETPACNKRSRQESRSSAHQDANTGGNQEDPKNMGQPGDGRADQQESRDQESVTLTTPEDYMRRSSY